MTFGRDAFGDQFKLKFFSFENIAWAFNLIDWFDVQLCYRIDFDQLFSIFSSFLFTFCLLPFALSCSVFFCLASFTITFSSFFFFFCIRERKKNRKICLTTKRMSEIARKSAFCSWWYFVFLFFLLFFDVQIERKSNSKGAHTLNKRQRLMISMLTCAKSRCWWRATTSHAKRKEKKEKNTEKHESKCSSIKSLSYCVKMIHFLTK